jgi:Glycosyltransferase family 25 (LPS biosynthesis protein)
MVPRSPTPSHPGAAGSDRATRGSVTRVKLLGDWCDSETLCRLWNKMTQGAFRWNDIEVTWRDEDVDYYAVINGQRSGEHAVPERTILFSLEPPLRRQGHRPPPVDPRPFLQVHDYRTHLNPLEWHLGQTYAELKVTTPYKSRVLSAVVSSSHELPGHRRRIAFLKFLESRGLAFDLYGYRNDFDLASYVGPLPAHRKDDGILPYRYTFNAENQAVPNYVTEKLADAILGECVCFYWGCPNVQDHLDPRAYVVLDLEDFEASYRRIVAAIRDDEWSQRLAAIRREKHRILDELQFFPTLERVIREHELAVAAVGPDVALAKELPYLLRRYRIAAGRQTGTSAAVAAYLRHKRLADGGPGSRTLLFVSDRSPAPPDLSDRCAVVPVDGLLADGQTLGRSLHTAPVSYRCGSARISVPREWLTIEEDVPVKVMNLDRRPDRWARMVETLGRAGLRHYERVSARDGKRIRAGPDELALFHGNHFRWQRGVIGCALSHLELWRRLASSLDPRATWLILEDDVRFASDFLAEWSRRHDEADQFDPGWELWFLGLHVNPWAHRSEAADAALGPEPARQVTRLTGIPAGVTGGTFAYVLRRTGAWKLLASDAGSPDGEVRLQAYPTPPPGVVARRTSASSASYGCAPTTP